jgi:predicted nucleic acid-binding protein
LSLAERNGFSIFDALIVAGALKRAATRSGRKTCNHGLVVDQKLTIRNPFLH